MSASDWVAATVAVAAAILVGGLLAVLASFAATLRSMRRTLAELRTETAATVSEMREVVAGAADDAARVEALLETAEASAARLDSASRLAYRTVSGPVVKALALGTGTRQAVRRMRRGNGR
jgi:uncharacterized protein YoxC